MCSWVLSHTLRYEAQTIEYFQWFFNFTQSQSTWRIVNTPGMGNAVSLGGAWRCTFPTSCLEIGWTNFQFCLLVCDAQTNAQMMPIHCAAQNLFLEVFWGTIQDARDQAKASFLPSVLSLWPRLFRINTRMTIHGDIHTGARYSALDHNYTSWHPTLTELTKN